MPLTLATTITAVSLLSAAPKFTSMWKSPDAASVTFAGKKVAALVITQDDSLRVSGEESLVRELTARGLQSVATYRIAPKEELKNPDHAKGWFEKSSVDGVVAMRPVSKDKRTTYNPGVWMNPYYSTLWGLLRLRLGQPLHPRFVRGGHHRRRRDHNLQRPAQQTIVGGGQRDQESEGPATLRPGPGEGIGEGPTRAGIGPKPSQVSCRLHRLGRP